MNLRKSRIMSGSSSRPAISRIFGRGLAPGERRLVRAPRARRSVDVGDRDEAGLQRDARPMQPLGVAGPIPTLVDSRDGYAPPGG